MSAQPQYTQVPVETRCARCTRNPAIFSSLARGSSPHCRAPGLKSNDAMNRNVPISSCNLCHSRRCALLRISREERWRVRRQGQQAAAWPALFGSRGTLSIRGDHRRSPMRSDPGLFGAMLRSLRVQDWNARARRLGTASVGKGDVCRAQALGYVPIFRCVDSWRRNNRQGWLHSISDCGFAANKARAKRVVVQLPGRQRTTALLCI